MNAKEMRKWADAMAGMRMLSESAILRASETEWAEEVERDLDLILDLVLMTEETLRKGGRISPAQWTRMAAATSVFKHAVRLAIELPGLDAPDIWKKSEPLVLALEDATYDLWDKVEQHDLGMSTEIRGMIDDVPGILRILATLDNPRVGRRPITIEVRADVWDKSRGICWYCGVELHPFRNFHVDHYVPVVDGGGNEMTNLVPSCQPCNSRKQARPAEYLRRFIGSGKFWFEVEEREP